MKHLSMLLLAAIVVLAGAVPVQAEHNAAFVRAVNKLSSQLSEIRPLDKQVTMQFRDVPKFRLRITAGGHVTPFRPQIAVARFELWGSVAQQDDKLVWQYRSNFLNYDGKKFSPQKPLLELDLTTNDRGVATRWAATFPAFAAAEKGLRYETDEHFQTILLARALMSGAVRLPIRPISQDDPILDLTPLLASVVRGAEKATLAQPLPAAFVVGTATHEGRQVIVAQINGDTAIEAFGGRADAAVQGAVLIDQRTGLPLRGIINIKGPVRAPGVSGDLDYVVNFETTLYDGDSDRPTGSAREGAGETPSGKVSASTVPNRASLLERLKLLKTMLDEGLISKADYDTKKRDILNDL